MRHPTKLTYCSKSDKEKIVESDSSKKPNRLTKMTAGSKSDKKKITKSISNKKSALPTKISSGSKSSKKKTIKIIAKKEIPKIRTVKQIESYLSAHNSKTCNFVLFLKYLKVKNRINRCLFNQYQDRVYRKLKWNSFINTQKSESKMLKNFQKKFGSPEETNVVIGDYDKINNPKGKESCLTKGLRKLLRDFGYNLFLINEFRTSKLCNNCHGCVENFKIGISKRKWNKGEEVLIWGLVRCKNDKCRLAPRDKTKRVCSIHNRDQNAVRNMLYIVKELIDTGKRPEIFTRQILAGR